MHFVSPTKGRLSFEEMMEDIIKYIKGLPSSSYKIIIGSDSQVKSETCFITAVIVHRLGKGARYYYRKKTQRKIRSLRQKIFYETALSLEVGGMVHKYFAGEGFDDLNVEIHIDVGLHGETKDLIREVVGMVTGSGFRAKIKPEAYGASSVADKHTK
ncbi:MAG: ribonuclease H-like YkuK family protein [Peptococcaceae bacterium]|nr:ribonuclease H-like YkuK family protein [Peptococcaceae bacterium]